MKNICFLLIIVVLTSCNSTLPVTDFKAYHPLAELNGTYLQKDGSLAMTIPGVIDWTMKESTLRPFEIDNVEIRFNGKDSIAFLWFNQDTLLKESRYKGEIKDNFFEIKLKWKNLIFFPFFVDYQRDRLRLGLTDDNHLITHYWHDNTGGIFLLMGGYNAEYKSYYERLEHKPSNGQYEFITTPDSQGNSKSILSNKWALLDKSNNRITGYDYDHIDYYDKGMDGYRIVIEKKENEEAEELMGYIDTNGNLIIPAEYKSIQDTELPGVKKVYQHGEHTTGRYFSSHASFWGFITRERVICPPILTQIESEFKTYNKKGLDPTSKYCKVMYQNKSYLLGLDGYLYPYSSFMGNISVKTDKRIKIGYDF